MAVENNFFTKVTTLINKISQKISQMNVNCHIAPQYAGWWLSCRREWLSAGWGDAVLKLAIQIATMGTPCGMGRCPQVTEETACSRNSPSMLFWCWRSARETLCAALQMQTLPPFKSKAIRMAFTERVYKPIESRSVKWCRGYALCRETPYTKRCALTGALYKTDCYLQLFLLFNKYRTGAAAYKSWFKIEDSWIFKQISADPVKSGAKKHWIRLHCTNGRIFTAAARHCARAWTSGSAGKSHTKPIPRSCNVDGGFFGSLYKFQNAFLCIEQNFRLAVRFPAWQNQAVFV